MSQYQQTIVQYMWHHFQVDRMLQLHLLFSSEHVYPIFHILNDYSLEMSASYL